jgi:hypothetical protein
MSRNIEDITISENNVSDVPKNVFLASGSLRLLDEAFFRLESGLYIPERVHQPGIYPAFPRTSVFDCREETGKIIELINNFLVDQSIINKFVPSTYSWNCYCCGENWYLDFVIKIYRHLDQEGVFAVEFHRLGGDRTIFWDFFTSLQFIITGKDVRLIPSCEEYPTLDFGDLNTIEELETEV